MNILRDTYVAISDELYDSWEMEIPGGEIEKKDLDLIYKKHVITIIILLIILKYKRNYNYYTFRK
jgi:hypothetical protein